MVIVFILKRLIFRIVDFFHHWYVDGPQKFKEWLSGLRELSGRLGILGYFAYVLGAAILALIYLAWLLIPVYVIYMVFWGKK